MEVNFISLSYRTFSTYLLKTTLKQRKAFQLHEGGNLLKR